MSLPSSEKQPRVTLTGRVGAVEFGATQRGQPRLTFPLAVHPDPDTTEWHKILAFGERAQKLKGELTTGQLVEVIGYLHINEYNGTAVEEIYATVVRKPK